MGRRRLGSPIGENIILVNRPFHQLPFSQLPDVPRRPHGLAQARRVRVEVRSRHFGNVDTLIRVHGTGPPLLLLHGLMTSSYSWRYVIEPLGEHYRVYAPDLPGSGDTAKPDVSYAPDALADWIGELMSTLDILGCPIIGNSLGGYLAMRLALRQPTAMSRLVNVHSPAVPLARLYALRAALMLPGSRALLRWLVRRQPEAWVHRNVHYYDESLKSLEEARVYAEPLRTDDGLRAFWRSLRDTLDPWELRAFARMLKRRAGMRFPVPLMLMYAARDPVVPPIVGERLRGLIPDAEFVRIHHGSHFAHVDAVDEFLPAVQHFLGAT